ncbi:MAG: succinate dehydrogenase assembly factor 2, partial [Betaproteobacteria bacterium]|nr:succinate dehydrogenase assembly factor 2 [Betaproteobacteria bacterium]
MNRIELEKLKWKCRRGLLELDIVLDRYLKAGEPIAGLS